MVSDFEKVCDGAASHLFLKKIKKKLFRVRNIFTAVTSIRIESNKLLWFNEFG